MIFFSPPTTPARQDALFPKRRSQLAKILNVPRLESKLFWQLGVGG